MLEKAVLSDFRAIDWKIKQTMDLSIQLQLLKG